MGSWVYGFMGSWCWGFITPMGRPKAACWVIKVLVLFMYAGQQALIIVEVEGAQLVVVYFIVVLHGVVKFFFFLIKQLLMLLQALIACERLAIELVLLEDVLDVL